MEDRLATITEMAEIIRVSDRTVRRYIARGLPVLRVGGARIVRIEVAAAIDWLRAGGPAAPRPRGRPRNIERHPQKG